MQRNEKWHQAFSNFASLKFRSVPPAMSKKVLKISDSGEYDFLIAGIATGLKDYKLCFEINRTLGMELASHDDVMHPAGRPGAFTIHSHYHCRGQDGEVYYLLGNRDRNRTGFYIQELKTIDYFFVISHPVAGFNLSEVVKLLRNIHQVSAVYPITNESVKSLYDFVILTES